MADEKSPTDTDHRLRALECVIAAMVAPHSEGGVKSAARKNAADHRLNTTMGKPHYNVEKLEGYVESLIKGEYGNP